MYTFSRSEKTKPIAEEYETRAMLYLMNTTKKEDIHLFLIDSFNDISGTGMHFNYIVDMQAKGIKKFPPSKIGESLITLFLNHISDIKFNSYILYCKNLDDKYLKTNKCLGISCHKFDEICDETSSRIKNALSERIDKVLKKEAFIQSLDANLIESFFDNLYIVIDSGLKSEHIKNILPMTQLNKLSDISLEAIFKDITDKRISLKTNINIENQTIIKAADCLYYKKYLQRKTIESLVVSRLIGYDIFNHDNTIPLYFSSYVDGLGIEEKKDILQLVNSEVSKAFFDINNSKVFFEFLDIIIEVSKSSKDVELIFNNTKVRGRKIPPQLTEISAKFLISMVIGGLYDN